jgi:hypothetical protein
MDKKKVTKEEAVSLLNDGDRIHTFRNNSMMLIGADWDRSKLIQAIEKYEDTLEIAGEQARGMKHALVIKDDTGHLFIETNEEKLNIFDPIGEK